MENSFGSYEVPSFASLTVLLIFFAVLLFFSLLFLASLRNLLLILCNTHVCVYLYAGYVKAFECLTIFIHLFCVCERVWVLSHHKHCPVAMESRKIAEQTVQFFFLFKMTKWKKNKIEKSTTRRRKRTRRAMNCYAINDTDTTNRCVCVILNYQSFVLFIFDG